MNLCMKLTIAIYKISAFSDSAIYIEQEGNKTYRKSDGDTEESYSVCSSTKVYLAGIHESPILPCSIGRTWF